MPAPKKTASPVDAVTLDEQIAAARTALTRLLTQGIDTAAQREVLSQLLARRQTLDVVAHADADRQQAERVAAEQAHEQRIADRASELASEQAARLAALKQRFTLPALPVRS
jgi:hypothetical protein